MTNEYTYMGGGVDMGDFNNDGLQDIFFSANQTTCKLYLNEGGMHFKDITARDGIATNQWCTGVSIVDVNDDGFQDIYVCVNGPVKAGKRQNLLFMNNHDLTFTERGAAHGAAYADLDNDGDLDLVVNNINSQAFVFSNNSINPANKTANYLQVKLTGPKGNRDVLGTVVKLFVKDSILLLEQNPVRGYLSTMDKKLFAGLGKSNLIDSMQITWPNDSMQTLKNIKTNQLLNIDYKNVTGKWQVQKQAVLLFINYTHQSGISFSHLDTFFFDFGYQRLIPQKYSAQGPGIAVGDVNMDGLPDFFVGNGYEKKEAIFIQHAVGSFTAKPLETGEKFEEDTGCLFFDADGDGNDDLLVTSGTKEFERNSRFNLPRLYTNDGKGNFARQANAIPSNLIAISTVVKACDFDNDGDLDLFIGSRVNFRDYPTLPPSYLLQNNKGIFTNVTKTWCPELSAAGMITDAAWMDVDGDKKEDLVVTGEWMPIGIFKNQDQRFKEITNETGLANLPGMWRSIV